MATQTDVVIIGAGAAGLAAAKALTRQGTSFILLEGAHRIGGRAYSEEIAPGTWFDLGCAYIIAGPDVDQHIDESNPIIDFAREQGAHLQPYDYPERFHYNGRLLAGAQLRACQAYFRDCDQAIRASAVAGEDRAISELIDLESPFATPYFDMMAVTAPMDLDEASAADFHYKIEEYTEFNSLAGYGNLVALWGSDVEVSLNSRVNSVDWSGAEVQVNTGKGSISAKCVICTVSTGVLAAQHIDFIPQLPDWKMAAIQGLAMGGENKIGVHFTRDIFDPEASGYYQAWSSEAQGAYIDVNLMANRVVSVFIGGRFSAWMEKQGPQAAHEFAVDRIADLFGNDIRRSVGRSIASAWITDPWTLGSYAAALPGQFHQRRQLPLPLEKKLFFAGEATARCNGTLHGACWSGIRAAREVVETLSG